MKVYGHEAAAASFLDAAAGGRLHHAWLIAGPPGIGKARFAEGAALRLLADAAGPAVHGAGLDVPGDHPIARLVAAGSHPDFRRLARLEKVEKGEGTGEFARNISVAQVRELGRMFATTPSLSPRRAILVDAIDDMEAAAANALLKNLEEPPAGTLFLLVSHAPGRLLPTIRSRCRLLKLSPLDEHAMRSALAAALPDAEAEEIDDLVRAGAGSPGKAVRIAGLKVAALDAAMAALIRDGDPHNGQRSALAKQLAGKAAQPRYELFLERAPAVIAAAARTRTGDALAEAIALWERARRLADGAVRLSLDPQATVFELAGMLARLAPVRS